MKKNKSTFGNLDERLKKWESELNRMDEKSKNFDKKLKKSWDDLAPDFKSLFGNGPDLKSLYSDGEVQIDKLRKHGEKELQEIMKNLKSSAETIKVKFNEVMDQLEGKSPKV